MFHNGRPNTRNNVTIHQRSPKTVSNRIRFWKCFVISFLFYKVVLVVVASAPGPSRNPLFRERTGVSGFGSRSPQKTIFQYRSSPLICNDNNNSSSSSSNNNSNNNNNFQQILERTLLSATHSAILTKATPKHHNNKNDNHSANVGNRTSIHNTNTERNNVTMGSETTTLRSTENDGSAIMEDITITEDIETIDGLETTTNDGLETRWFTEHPKLWVQRSKDPDILWIQTRTDDDTIIETLRITISKKTKDWQVDRAKGPGDSSMWMPVEGIYGIYQLPSGIVWVLVTNSEPVFTAPSIPGNGTHSSWWQVRRVVNLELVHMSRPETLLSPPQLKEEVRQLKLLRKTMKAHELYFCSNGSNIVTDMTKNLQQSLQENLAESGVSDETWWDSKDRRPDPRFFWNQASVDPILERYHKAKPGSLDRRLTEQIIRHILPLTSAFVGVQANLTVSNKYQDSPLCYHQVLISRRSRFRAGTRFAKRGADESGAVANYVETEQICLVVDDHHFLQQIFSHVQTRGSIPLLWASPTDIKTYRPRVRLGTDPLAQARALRLHLVEQYTYYVTNDGKRNPHVPEIIFVNLVDKHSDQGRLGRTFDAVLNAVMEIHNHTRDLISSGNETLANVSKGEAYNTSFGPRKVEHVWFDFHAEVKNGKWDKLGDLLKQLKSSLTEHSFFYALAPNGTVGWQIKSRQNAVVRTNCMDCLDRTNVAQSIFGRFLLFQQLSMAATHHLSEHPDPDPKSEKFWVSLRSAYKKNSLTLPWSNGEAAHRLLWANNADAISQLYAGTPALKRDFTRTGKRTKLGALDDGMNSLQRYYLNNFLDADRQEGMDLMVGYATFSNALVESSSSSSSSIGDGQDDGCSNLTVTDDERFDVNTEQEVARQALLGDVLNGLSDEQKKDLENRLGEVDIPVKSLARSCDTTLDLRWLPGDLQGHLRFQASQAGRNSRGSTERRRIEFNSKAALEAIDQRASTDDPWWSVIGDSSSDDSEKDDSDNPRNGTSVAVDPPQTNGGAIHHPHVSTVQLLIALVLGIKSPLALGAAVVGLLAFVYMQEVLEWDGII